MLSLKTNQAMPFISEEELEYLLPFMATAHRQLEEGNGPGADFTGWYHVPDINTEEDLQRIVLKGEDPITERPGKLLPDEDFGKIRELLEREYDETPTQRDVLSYSLYPKVYMDYIDTVEKYSDLSDIPSDVFFYGLREGETAEVSIEDGKTLIITLLNIGKHDEHGEVRLSFEVNGNRRDVKVFDENYFKPGTVIDKVKLADKDNPDEIGASINGKIEKIFVKEGDEVREGDVLIVVEAMKMESSVVSHRAGTIERVSVEEGESVETGQLLITFK